MKNRLIYRLPQLFMLILLAVVIVLSYKAITKNDGRLISPVLTPLSGEQTIDGNHNPESQDNGQPQDSTKIPEIDSPKVISTTVFPKQASASDSFLYTQTLSGDGNVYLKNVLQTSVAIYVIAEAEASFHKDIICDKRSVVLFEADTLGVINAYYIVPSLSETTHICSQITSKGITVFCKNSLNEGIVYIFDIIKKEFSVYTVPPASKGKIFTTNNNFLLLTESEQNKLYSFDNEILVAFLCSGEIIEICDFYTYYLIFLNQTSGYKIIKLSKNLNLLEETTVTGGQLLDILPSVENNKQVFYIAEKWASGSELWKYDKDFSKQNGIKNSLGDVKRVSLCQGDDELLLAFEGLGGGIVTLDSSLSYKLSTINLQGGLSELYDCINYAKSSFYLLVKNENGLSLINVREDKAVIATTLNEGSNPFLIINGNGTTAVFCQLINEEEKSEILITGLP